MVAYFAGHVLVNYIHEYQIENGVPKAEAYTVTMYIMAGLLMVGFVCNLLVRPVGGVGLPTYGDPGGQSARPPGPRHPRRTRQSAGGVNGPTCAVPNKSRR